MSNRQQTQDYIARIRYSNALPPPPFAPKLLNIQNATLESGEYTSIGFSSRLYREQPLNIETDAELGMRIDLIGLPGIFDEDQTAITYPERPPPLDPRDRALLKPLASLGKGPTATSGVSFLRRTEYITSHTKGKDDTGGALRSKLPANRRPAQPKPQAPKTDREGIIRQIEKSFNTAYPKDSYTGPDTSTHLKGAEVTKADREGWFNPKHPTNPSLKVLDSYPILPDLQALPDSGTYVLIKFNTNPSSISNAYDTKLDHLILQPREPADDEQAAYLAEMDEYKANRISTRPMQPEDYVAYIPSGDADEVVPGLKRKFDLFDKSRDDDELYTVQDAGHQALGAHFTFDRLRAYETNKKQGSAETMWNDHVALSLHDGPNAATKKARGPDAPSRQKAAYIYPIMSRSQLRQKRLKTDRLGRRIEEDEERKGADVLEVVVGEFDENARAEVEEKVREYDPQAVV